MCIVGWEGNGIPWESKAALTWGIPVVRIRLFSGKRKTLKNTEY